ncbi:MAG: glycosyltransferase family 4 protein [Pseudomonadota bacterium]
MSSPDLKPLISHINLARGFRGGERQTELLIRELDALGFRQRLIAKPSEPLIVRLADLPALERRPVSGIVGATRAARGSDIVHSHEGRGIQAAALAGLYYKVPYVVTRRVTRPLKANPITRGMYQRAAALIGLSRHISQQLADYVGHTRIETVPSAYMPTSIDKDRVRALRERFGSQPIIGHVGALVIRHKGQPMLIDIARARPEYTIVLVGGGEDEQTLRHSAEGLSNVIFTGHVEDVPNHLAAFDVFAFPSRFEGLGSTLLDAIARELPVVASDVDGIPDIIQHETNGLLAPNDDLELWLQHVDRLVEDQDLGNRFALYNRELLSRYSAERMATAYRDLYASILG